LEIARGEFVALTGRSGSGKSTLLHILGSLDTATEGTVTLGGRELSSMAPEELCRFRNREMGFVFQFHYLLAELDAIGNVLMPARKAKETGKRRDYAVSLLRRFGLGEAMHRLPRQLSGGEQQRVAIARALLMEPGYLFADEPTGSLDSVNGGIVLDILKDCNRNMGTTVVLVTHDPDFAALAGRTIHLADGKLVP
jgi:putative ABC transport system ATP-binding protein/lipoprotein-releasing system ATP-binding protein